MRYSGSTDAGKEGRLLVVTQPDPLKIEAYPHTARFLLLSDLHIGSAFVDYDRIEQEFKLAREMGATVLINGDVFDAVLPSDMKRFNPTCLHPRLHNRADILNASIEWACEIFEPYKDLIGLVGVGNHDTALEKHHSVDAVALLCDRMGLNYGGYCGYFIQSWVYGLRNYHRLKIRYHHGAGGASPVTKGITDFQRMAAHVDGDTDLVWVGHKHNRLLVNSVRENVTAQGNFSVRQVINVMTGSYLDTYREQSSQDAIKNGRRANYAADWNIAPQDHGGAILEVSLNKNGKQMRAYLT